MKKIESLELKQQTTFTQTAADNMNAIVDKINELVTAVNLLTGEEKPLIDTQLSTKESGIVNKEPPKEKECPQIERYAVCNIKGCGVCGNAKELLTPKPELDVEKLLEEYAELSAKKSNEWHGWNKEKAEQVEKQMHEIIATLKANLR